MFEKEKTEKKKAQHRRPGTGRHQMERGIKEGGCGRDGCLCRTIWSGEGAARFAFLFAPFSYKQKIRKPKMELFY